MAKSELTRVAVPKCERIADQMGFELVDVCLEKEPAGQYLRIYIDRPEGMDLDSCEKFHRAIQPLLEDFDYDFLEVSSPGIDRPLKKDRDFERAIGSEVEIHLFKAQDGVKDIRGILADFTADEIVLETPAGEKRVSRKAAASVRPVVDMTGVEDVDLSDGNEADSSEQESE